MSQKRKKKPDLVVWDTSRGYYQQSLPYGSDLAAPSINLDNVSGWKQTQALEVNKLFSTKYEEIRKQLLVLYNEVKWNEYVYSSEIRFTPIVNEIYYLYRREDGTVFMSLISPEEWDHEFVGATRIDSHNKWIKV